MAIPTTFTPVSALLGGLLIGAAVLLLYHTLGRIAGISGMVAGGLRAGTPGPERSWRLVFLLGLIGGPLIPIAILRAPLIQPSPTSPLTLIIAGLAVGLGTGLANGCTSGHGICGVSRLSLRSLVATAIFMICGFMAASVLRHLFGV